MLLSFNKTEEGLQTDCQILKVAIQLWLNDVVRTQRDVISDQLLEFVIEVKEESSSALSSLLIYLPCKIGTVINKSDTFLDPNLRRYNDTRYTEGRFRITNDFKRLVSIDGIEDVKILNHKNVLIDVKHFNTLAVIRMDFTTPIEKGEKAGFRLLFSEVSGIATYDVDSSTLRYSIEVFAITPKLSGQVENLHINEEDRVIKAKTILDPERLLGGFDIALYLPQGFYFASNTPQPHEEFLMTLGLLSSVPPMGKERYTGIWRARKIIKKRDLIGIGDKISIRGTATNIGLRLNALSASGKKAMYISLAALAIALITIIIGKYL